MFLRWCLVLIVLNLALSECDQSDLETQLQLLSKQVTALLDKREEDLRTIEDSMRKKLLERLEFGDIQEQMRKLRLDIEVLKSGTDNLIEDKSLSHEKNEKVLVKWLTQAVKELKTEVVEVQDTLNSTAILENHELLDTDLNLLKTDVSNLNKELELTRTKNAKFEAEINSLKEELMSMKDNYKSTAVGCGKMKNQMKALQLEFIENMKMLTEKSSLTFDNDPHPRHNRLLKEHIVQLEKKSKLINKENFFLRKRIMKIENQMKNIKAPVVSNDIESNDIPGNPEAPPVILKHLADQTSANTESIANLTKQLTDFDKLHMSMLELLENVENVEAKVDKNIPDFRKEISKMEVQIAQGIAAISLLKEDFRNSRSTVKAISASVSNLQDSFKVDHSSLKDVVDQITTVKKLTNQQASKLHGHILQNEESGVVLNATKAAIHLVNELETFEKGYKNIINKLPHDCSSVLGPKGAYLISPGEDKPVLSQCDNGWTTIQKRYNGNVDFNRNWTAYSQGFGSVDGEHWLGNKNIHYLTKNNCTTLQIKLEDIYGQFWEANYNDFRVGDELNGFKLFVGNFSGNCSSAFEYQNNMEFSTVDNDRDISNTHCASNYEGGNWYSHCQHANLNGRYNLGLTWFHSEQNQWLAIKSSEMRVKVRSDCS